MAEWLLSRGAGDPAAEAARYVNEEVPDGEAALQGARDIIAERLSDDATLRAKVRAFVRDRARLRTNVRAGAVGGAGADGGSGAGAVDRAGAGAGRGRGTGATGAEGETGADRAAVYEAYAEYEEPLKRVPPHRILAMNRGEAEKVLTVGVALAEADEERLLGLVEGAALEMGLRSEPRSEGQSVEPTADRSVKQPGSRPGAGHGSRPARFGASPSDEHLRMAAHDGMKRLLMPSVEREIRNELTETAHEQALSVFRANLRALLLQAPLRGHVVVGLDPAFRTGVKVAVVDATGRLLATDVIYPTPPHNKTEAAGRRLTELVERHGATAIAIGNGTASRETERFVADWLRDRPADRRPAYAIIDESGASVYSASPLAKEEFPDLDVSERSAVSIARRLQDPLAELVKIEPRSLGIGQYQHDVDAKRLEEQLGGVVEGTVNEVGVDLNTASVSLLSYVAGVSKTVAANIVARRETEGPFSNRKQLLKVPRLGPRTFEQCAGFLQIPDAEYALDRTPIHPESYAAAEQLLAELGVGLDQIGGVGTGSGSGSGPGSGSALDSGSGPGSGSGPDSGYAPDSRSGSGSGLGSVSGPSSGPYSGPRSASGSAPTSRSGSGSDVGRAASVSARPASVSARPASVSARPASTRNSQFAGPVAAALDELRDDDIVRLAAKLGCGEPTLRDIIAALKRPGRDPREDLPPPALRSDVLDIDDLEPGMRLVGTVRNVVDFGAFVDIGVGQDGLVHISELADRFVKHPLDVVSVGDTVEVRVLTVDKRRNRIGLSMKTTA